MAGARRTNQQTIAGAWAALRAVLLLVAVFGPAVACVSAPSAVPAPSYPTNQVTFEGDSLMAQARAYADPSDGRFATDADGDMVNVPGGHVSAASGWTTIQARFDATADRRHLPQLLVITTGHNDANIDWGGDGWTWTDRNAYSDNVRSVPPEARVAIMLPGVGPSASAAHRTEVSRARRSIQAIIAENPDRVCGVSDFQATIDRNETAGTPIIVDDGIHKGTDAPRAAREYTDTVWAAVDQCGNAASANPIAANG